MFLAPKSALGRSRGPLFSHFGNFLRVRKIGVFLMPSGVVDKAKKSEPGTPKGRHKVDLGSSGRLRPAATGCELRFTEILVVPGRGLRGRATRIEVL